MNKNVSSLGCLGLVAAFFGFFFVSGFVKGFRFARYDTHRAKHFRAVEHGDTAAAIDEATAMISMLPDWFEGYMLRGEAYSRSGKHLRAITDLTASLDRLPGDRNQLKKLDRWTEARTIATLHYDRAIEYERTSQYARSLADVENALQFDPDMKDAHFVRGQVYLGLKQYQKAADDFDWSIQHHDDHLDYAYLLSAQSQAGCNHYQRAVEDMHKAIEARPDVHDLWINLGWYQYKAGQVADAITSDQTALSFPDQKEATPAFNLGLCYAMTGNEARAHAAYEQGLQMPASLSQVLPGAREDVADELKAHPGNPTLLKAQQWINGS